MRYIIQNKLILLLLIIITGLNSLEAQLTFQVYQNSVDVAKVPSFSFRIKAQLNGQEISLNRDNIVIIERLNSNGNFNQASVPRSVSAPAAGWQTVKWIAKQEYFSFHMEDPILNSDTIVVTYENNIAKIGITMSKPDAPLMIIKELFSGELAESIYFGNVRPGGAKRVEIIASLLIGFHDDKGREIPANIDSITTNNPVFSYYWIGHDVNRNPPPTSLNPGFSYLVDIFFDSPDENYYQGVMTFHYANGMKRYLNLYGNSFKIDRETSLLLIRPNGNEKLTPCQKYQIKWKGHSKSLPVKIHVSYDNGSSWETIAAVVDSVYMWAVPGTISDYVKIKVSQDFVKTKERLLFEDSRSVYAIKFNGNGSRLLAASDNGQIREWDLTSYDILKRYNASLRRGNDEMYCFGLEYVNDYNNIAAAYNNMSVAGAKRDTIAFFDSENSLPIRKAEVSWDFKSKEMLSDQKGRFLAMAPEFGNQLLLLSVEDGSTLRTVDFPSPVNSASFDRAGGMAAVSLLNGEIWLMALPDFSLIEKFTLPNVAIILEIAMAPNGKFIAMATKADGNGGKSAINVLDISSKMIVRSFYIASSDPVGLEFNSTSSLLVVGSKANPKIALMDLPSDQFAGGLSANFGEMTDFEFSPEGNAFATSAANAENLLYQTFNYPEEDLSDNNLRIIQPMATITGIDIEPAYLGQTSLHSFNSTFCNSGEVPVFLNNAEMKFGDYFKMTNSLVPDTLYPGECLNIGLEYTPLDTGRIVDTLIISYCNDEFYQPVESYGIPRDIQFFGEPFDFGEACVGDSIIKEIRLLRNNDPVPLFINSIKVTDPFSSPFRLMMIYADTLLAPGGEISIDAGFFPDELGEAEGMILVSHSNQFKFIAEFNVKARGIGTFIELSHEELLFIPEILTRKLFIKNIGGDDLYINDLIPDTPGIFTIVSTLPMLIPAGEERAIEIAWNGSPAGDINIDIDASPCVVNLPLKFGEYSASSQVSIPKVTADPRNEVEIPLNFTNNERTAYNGPRFFEAEITINPRLFLPYGVISDYGEGQLVRNEIVNDLRIIGIRIDGDFPADGTVAKIKGYAGLAEVASSPIGFTGNLQHWGSAVANSVSPGVFELTKIGNNRLIKHYAANVEIESIKPNPTGGDITIKISRRAAGDDSKESARSDVIVFEIIDNLGNVVMSAEPAELGTGANEIRLNVSYLPTGTYTVIVKSGNSLSSGILVVIH